MNANWLLLLCLAASAYMTGLIWLIQVVQYPLFALVGPDVFLAYHAAHSRLITPVVFVPMAVELGTALLLLVTRPAGVPAWSVWLSAVLAISVWAATALIQVPQHSALGRGFSEAVISALVAGNWVRTIAWTVHTLLLLWMTALAMRTG